MNSSVADLTPSEKKPMISWNKIKNTVSKANI